MGQSISLTLPKSSTIQKGIIFAALFAVMMLVGQEAFAAGTGGLDTLKTNATAWDKAIYAVVGIVASTYLVFVGIQVWMNKKTWGDFGTACFYVAVVGGITVLAPFLWGFFTS